MSSTLPSAAAMPTGAVRPQHNLAAASGIETPITDAQPAQSFSFSDFLSVINPLQHIPIVGTIYRAITGDTLAPAARVIGGTLFGGPIGLVASVFNAVIEQTNGKDLGDQVLAMVSPDSQRAPQGPALEQQAAVSSGSDAPEVSSTNLAPDVEAPSAVIAAAPPSPAVVMEQVRPAQERTLSGSLTGRHYNSTGDRATGAGRTLADYRNFAGRPLPTVDANRSVSSAPPVRLQTTAPIVPERGRTAVLAASQPVESAPTRPIEATAPDARADDAAAATPPTHWFQAAMMKGLDRYRETRRPDAPAAQLDTRL